MYSLEIVYNFVKEIANRGKRNQILYFILLGLTSLFWIVIGFYFTGSLDDKYD